LVVQIRWNDINVFVDDVVVVNVVVCALFYQRFFFADVCVVVVDVVAYENGI
jgi:hypothetical protein